jgi:hypothetical protein
VNLLTDCSALLLVKAAQSLPYRFGAVPNIQGVLGDFPQDASMSEGLHMNMSLFAQRKSTSTASYLGSRVVPTRTVLLLEHLQEFAKIHLANIMIWQLAKIYGK